MKRRATRSSAPSEREAEQLRREIHALGDYAHVTVRCSHGHLVICGDDNEPVARLTPLAMGRFGLSFHRHTGRWEPMPFIGDLAEQAHTLTAVLAPYLQRCDFSDAKSGSDH